MPLPRHLLLYPHAQDLGDYLPQFLYMVECFDLSYILCSHLSWFRELVRSCRLEATGPDMVVDVQAFIEAFYAGLAVADWEFYVVVRSIARNNMYARFTNRN